MVENFSEMRVCSFQLRLVHLCSPCVTSVERERETEGGKERMRGGNRGREKDRVSVCACTIELLCACCHACMYVIDFCMQM